MWPKYNSTQPLLSLELQGSNREAQNKYILDFYPQNILGKEFETYRYCCNIAGQCSGWIDRSFFRCTWLSLVFVRSHTFKLILPIKCLWICSDSVWSSEDYVVRNLTLGSWVCCLEVLNVSSLSVAKQVAEGTVVLWTFSGYSTNHASLWINTAVICLVRASLVCLPLQRFIQCACAGSIV